MQVFKIDKDIDKDKILKNIASTAQGNKIMKDKMDCHLFYIQDLRTPAANILKQDALSIGAELAVEKDTILCKDKYTNALLIVNEKQRKILSQKEKIQPFGLKEVAQVLAEYKPHNPTETKIMGVINANSDSFFEGSRFQGIEAIKSIEDMIEDGADIIDIGGVSSRPGSVEVPEEEELDRIKGIVDTIYEQKFYDKVQFSLDSYAPKVIDYALSRGFSIVNDITGLENDEVCELVKSYQVQVVIMHMQNRPLTMQDNPSYKHIISDVENFFMQRISKAKKFGIEDIVLDVGIGFGKNLEHNLMLIKHMGHFQKFNLPLLIGASRKSLIDKMISCDVSQRLPGTLVLHLKAIEEGASIVRCHDVKEHKQALVVHKYLHETLI